MGAQIAFFEKNKCDFSNESLLITASQADDYTQFLSDRSNDSAWMTTGSVDADLTSIIFDMVDEYELTDLFLVKHNFKAYTLKYWNGSAWTNFSTTIAETVNTQETNRHSFTQVATTKLQLIIQGTQVADADKRMFQFVATKSIGTLAGWPIINDPVVSRNRQRSVMLSGKKSIRENVGGFSCKLEVANWKSDADLTIVERLYDANDGFLMWLCGGSETQFSSVRQGYRKEDLFLMKCENEYRPEFYKGIYSSGLKMSLALSEVVD